MDRIFRFVDPPRRFRHAACVNPSRRTACGDWSALADLRQRRPAGALEYPGPAPGQAAATCTNDRIELHNSVIRVIWRTENNRLYGPMVTDHISQAVYGLCDAPAISWFTTDNEPRVPRSSRPGKHPTRAARPHPQALRTPSAMPVGG